MMNFMGPSQQMSNTFMGNRFGGRAIGQHMFSPQRGMQQMPQMRQLQMPQMPVGPSFNPMMNSGMMDRTAYSPMQQSGFSFDSGGMRPGDLSNNVGPIGAAYRQGRFQTMF